MTIDGAGTRVTVTGLINQAGRATIAGQAVGSSSSTMLSARFIRPPTIAAAFLAFAAAVGSCGSPSSRSTRASTPASTSQPPQSRPVTLAASTAPWTLPAPVSHAVALADGPDILVLGGLTRGDVSTPAVERIDPVTGTGGRAGNLALAVHDAAGATLGGRSVVFGGGSSTTVATVQAFTGQTATTVGRLPEPRSDVATAVVGNQVYVLGGFDGTRLVRSVVATTDGITFTSAGQLAQPVRYPAVAVEGGYVWVIGGDLGSAENATSGGQSDDIQRFDPTTGRTTVVGHLPYPLGHAGAVVFGHQLFVVGGRSGAAASAQIWRVDTATGVASQAGSLPGPRSDAGVVTVAGVGWVLGGELSGPASPLDTVVELRPGPA